MKPPFRHLLPAVILLAAACASGPEKLPPPKTSITLVLAPANRQVLTTLSLQGELKIILPAPEDGPGVVWEVVSNERRVLQETRPLKAIPHGTPDRAYMVTYQAIHPGRSFVRFAAVKPGQAESEPDDLYQVAVGVKAE